MQRKATLAHVKVSKIWQIKHSKANRNLVDVTKPGTCYAQCKASDTAKDKAEDNAKDTAKGNAEDKAKDTTKGKANGKARQTAKAKAEGEYC